MTAKRKQLEFNLCKAGHMQSPENQMSNGKCGECNKLSQHKHYLKTGRILPPDTQSTLQPYKEPLTPVEGGFGYQGTPCAIYRQNSRTVPHMRLFLRQHWQSCLERTQCVGQGVS